MKVFVVIRVISNDNIHTNVFHTQSSAIEFVADKIDTIADSLLDCSSKEYEQHLRRVRKLIHEGKFQQAIDIWNMEKFYTDDHNFFTIEECEVT